MDNCGYCGDPIPEPPHYCWLAAHYAHQESLAVEPASEFLDVGQADADILVPRRVKEVDISNY